MNTNTPSRSGPKDDLDDLEWEEGSVPNLNSEKNAQEQTISGVTVEFDVSPVPTKRKSIRRATAEEKVYCCLVKM